MFYMLDPVYNDLYSIDGFMVEREYIKIDEHEGLKEWERGLVPCWIPDIKSVPRDCNGERMYILYRIDIK